MKSRVIALENSFNRVGLDLWCWSGRLHAVVIQHAGLSRDESSTPCRTPGIDGQSLRHLPSCAQHRFTQIVGAGDATAVRYASR